MVLAHANGQEIAGLGIPVASGIALTLALLATLRLKFAFRRTNLAPQLKAARDEELR